MDSKSISRKGVGVRLPSLALAASGGDATGGGIGELAREVGTALWPSLGTALRSARTELEALVGGLRRDRERVLRDGTWLARQDELAARTRRTGWCMGVLAAAQGIDLLHERREPEGLRWMVAALAEACAFTLTPAASELPRIGREAGADWQVSLLAAACALQAGRSSSGRVSWALGHGTIRRLVFEMGPDPAARPRGALLLAIPGLPASPRIELGAGAILLIWE